MVIFVLLHVLRQGRELFHGLADRVPLIEAGQLQRIEDVEDVVDALGDVKIFVHGVTSFNYALIET